MEPDPEAFATLSREHDEFALSPPVVDEDASNIAQPGSGTNGNRSLTLEKVEGRTYYDEGKYPLPNDKPELERLDTQHTLFTITFGGKLNLAPVEKPLHVLDIACGTGLWAIEFANEHPTAQVVGNDLSAIQRSDTSSNCRFEIADLENAWKVDTKFNYIHGRALLTCFKDPSFVIRQAFDALEPGGFLEFHDILFPPRYASPPPPESNIQKWADLCIEGGANSGRPWNNVQFYKKWFEDAGFENVVEKEFYWPISPWAKGEYYKKLSKYVEANLSSGIEGMSHGILQNLGWDDNQIRKFLIGVREDMGNTKIHSYMPIRVVYGRKPRLFGD